MDKGSRKPITPFISTVLDSLRILSATVVVVYHAFLHWLPNSAATAALSNSAHAAVVVFFVLSGYLIAFSTSQKKTPFKYFHARFSRLYSILIPGLIITALCEFAIKLFNHDLYAHYTRGNSLPRYVLSFFYSNELWFLSSAPPLNSPLWSLGFEFWYYMIFGLIFFRKEIPRSVLLTAVVLVLVGPKILLLMPVWLLGYAAYKLPGKSVSLGLWCCGALLATVIAVVIFMLPAMPYRLGTAPLLFASQFLTDWILGFIVAVMIWLIPAKPIGKISEKAIKRLRLISDLTFPLYVIHMPIIVLYDMILHPAVSQTSHILVPALIVISVCIFIGYFLERYAYLWYRLFETAFIKLQQRLSGGTQ